MVNKLPENLKPPLHCQTQTIEIKTTNEKEIKREIANAMFDCWDMLGRGKIDFLGKETKALIGFVPGKAACLICSKIEFSDKVKNKVSEIKDFSAYLNEAKIPNHEVTYSEFLLDKKGASIELLDPSTPSKMPTDKKYAVVFMNIKGTSIQGILGQMVGFGGAFGGGAGLSTKMLLGKIAPKIVGKVFWVAGGAMAVYEGVTGIITYKKAGDKCEGNPEGCSALFLIPYEGAELNKICENLKSLP